MNYDPQKIEQKWQKKWEKEPELYSVNEKSRAEKRYILDMFPYPSSDGLHTGHVESYTATDIISRYLRMKGYNVLHPQGWDAFGLPAENYAIKTKTHPSLTTQKAIKNFKKQMNMMGFSYDWSREINSSDPNYYKWTQWFFLLLYKNGLAYKAKAKVNWCKDCQTVLANEQAEGGICERCKNPVIQRDLEQWFFKITNFIEDQGETSGLISGLGKVDWPEHTKIAQLNWIGKSEGAEIDFLLENSKEKISVFTTRIDTIFSGTFLILAPEHLLVDKITQPEHRKEIEEYVQKSKNKTELERLQVEKEKTGVFTGAFVANPATEEKIPVWISDFVLPDYGTGAVFADAHDERDFEMAKKFGIPLKVSIRPEDENLWQKVEKLQECYSGDGILVNSGQFNGLISEEARKEIPKWLAKKGLARVKINYKIRDWLVSRQRYWGAPIPIIYCEKCGEVPVPEKDLPVELPDDVDFKPTGESPLINSKKFHNVKCPKCEAQARREFDTMDTFVCSSWYYFRYADPKNEKEFASKERIKYWLPVDLYLGGAEHTVLHLLYARFFTKVLHNLGYIGFDEPFLKLRHQGIILAEDGRKMSKSLGNVINPDDVVKECGADTLRLFEMFMGPLEDMKPWSIKSIVGVRRFLEKVWKLKNNATKDVKENEKITILFHKTLKKVTEDIENLKFNTALAAMMILVNELQKEKEISKAVFGNFLKILAPFAPHIAQELWEGLGNKESIFKESWPEYDKKLVKDQKVTLIVQINGRVRDKIEVEANIEEKEAKELALSSDKIKKWLEGKEPKNIVFVPGKLVNIVL